MSEPGALKRILILDDDGDFRRLLKVYLAKLLPGVDVAEYDPVARGAPGPDFDWTPYDALILDYYLCIHNVTGLDILQAHRKNRFFPATIMMTGAGNEEVAVRALRAGVYDYLRKEKFDKEQLKQSLLSAVEKHQVERAKQMEQTNQTRAFNKALFYQELEQGDDDQSTGSRVLLLVEIDGHEVLEERFGVIIRDNIVRHLARQCYEFFKLGSANPHITRLNDQSVALLINDPGSFIQMSTTMDALCAHLQRNPYRFEDKKLRFTVSIGVVPVPRSGRSAEKLLGAARECVGMAAIQEGNSFHIFVPKAAPSLEEEFIPEPVAEPAQVPDIPEPEPVPEPAPQSAPPEPAPPAARSEPKPAAPAPAPRPVPAPPPRPAAAPPRPVPAPATPTPKPAPVKPAPAAPAAAPQPAPKPAAPAPAATATAAPRDDMEIDESTLDLAALKVKRAFSDNRVMQLYRPMISLTNVGQDGEREVYRVNLQLVDTDGEVEEEARIYAAAAAPAFSKFIDRWLLRETIGRVVNHKADRYLFLLRLSEASLADPGLFNWLRKLLAGLDKQQPGKSIALELAAADYVRLVKPAGALMNYLHKSHGFRFALGQVQHVEDVQAAAGQGARFDLLLMPRSLLKEMGQDAGGQRELLDRLRERGQRIVVDGIEDATSLTDAIALGADFAMGRFVGEPIQQLEDTTSVESVELG